MTETQSDIQITLPPSAMFNSYRRDSDPMFFVAVEAPVSANSNPAPARETIQRRSPKHLACAVLLRIFSLLCYMALLSIPRAYRCKFRDTSPYPVSREGIGEGDLPWSWQSSMQAVRSPRTPRSLEGAFTHPLRESILQTSMLCWARAVPQLIKGWKTIQFGSGILIPCCFTVLQIEPVLDKIVMRTLVLAAAVLAMASLTCSTLYTLCATRWIERCILIEWLCASHYPVSELDFWNFLSLPAIFFSWSLILFFLTVTLFSWGDRISPESSDSTNPVIPCLVSGVIIILSIFISIVQIYRAFTRLYMMER